MNAPDPKANTTTEAYLAYKAGYLEESELKPSLYEPYLHFDAWLAYWAGLTSDYPVTISKKNLFDINSLSATGITIENGVASGTAQAFNTAFGLGIPLLLEEKQYTLSITGYTDGNQSTEASSGLGFRLGYTDGTYSSYVYWSNSDTTDKEKTLTTASGKTPNALYITFANKGQNIWHLSKIQLEQSSSATPYEPYSTPEMLTDEEALVAYLSGVTNTYPEDIKDPYDVRIVGYLKHLVSVRWPEPDYPVNNEEFYLSTMEPRHTSNPEPSSDIELDTADGKIISVEAYGDTSQTTYTGKNLFDGILESGIINGNTGNDMPNADYVRSKDFIAVDELTNYTISSTNTNISAFLVYEYKADYSYNLTANIVVQKNSYWQTKADTKYIRFRPNILSSDTTMKFQVEKGTAPTAWEPYVGGVPSPNPDYPQNVNVVTGRQEVKMEGKNLLPVDGGYIKKNHSTSADVYDLDLNGTFTVSADIYAPENSAPGSAGCVGMMVDGVWNYILIPQGSLTAPTSASLTKTGHITKVQFTSNGAAVNRSYNEYSNIQLEAGSRATDYTPYQSGTYEINLGKNLFDISKVITSTQVTNNGDGTLTISTPSGSSTAAAGLPNKLSDYCPDLKVGDVVTLSFDTTGNEKYIYLYGPGANLLWGIGTSTRTKTITQAMLDAMVLWYASGSNTTATISNIQVELGDTPTDYAPYFEPIELCKIGDYQDYIYKSGDDWYLHKEIGKHTMLSTDNYYWSAGDHRCYTDALTNTIAIPELNEKISALSTKFVPLAMNTLLTGSEGFSCYTTGNISFRKNTWNSVDDAKGVIVGTIIYYALATPTDTKITDSTLIGQLDALADADTYDSKTYIKVTATDPNLPALLKVEAYSY